MKVMGVDVGFAKSGRTTGIACLNGDELSLARAGTAWDSRKEQIPEGFEPSVIALDGPLLPQGANATIRRRCESLLNRAPFSRRCKPGFSHWGFGLKLRTATAEACAQFAQTLFDSTLSTAETFVSSEGPIVEAFPNAFLGVLMPEDEFLSAPKLERGRRFDWLYDSVAGTGRLKSIFSGTLDLPEKVWQRLSAEEDHELRAALICLLTAACATTRSTANRVGDAEGGWFWLPPLQLWQRWASDGLNRAEEKCRLKTATAGNN